MHKGPGGVESLPLEDDTGAQAKLPVEKSQSLCTSRVKQSYCYDDRRWRMHRAGRNAAERSQTGRGQQTVSGPEKWEETQHVREDAGPERPERQCAMPKKEARNGVAAIRGYHDSGTHMFVVQCSVIGSVGRHRRWAVTRTHAAGAAGQQQMQEL